MVFINDNEYSINPLNMFDNDSKLIPLEEWINQIVAISHGKPITIEKLIRLYANKSGGAHVDNELDYARLLVETAMSLHIEALAEYALKRFKRI